MSKSAVAVFISSFALAACVKQAPAPASELQPATGLTAATPQAAAPGEQATSPATATGSIDPAPLQDAQIVRVLEALDNGEIEQAQVALQKSKSERVQRFAQHMLDQHQKSKQKGLAIARKEAFTPAESEAAKRVTYQANAFIESLRTADAAGFDSLYIGAQDGEHEHLLNVVRKQLVPAASNAELRGLLAESMTMIASHVAEAKRIEQELKHDSEHHATATQ